VLRTPITGDQGIKLREEVIRIALVQPANEEKDCSPKKRQDSMRGDSQGNKFREFGGYALSRKRSRDKLISSSLGEQAGDDGDDDEQDGRQVLLRGCSYHGGIGRRLSTS
jgi:hypothetical protein